MSQRSAGCAPPSIIAMKTKKICGQPCFELKSPNVDLALTQESGHGAPAVFRLGKQKVTPFSVVPWANDKFPKGTERILKNLRGDFFCLPFGGNGTAIPRLKYGVKGGYKFECHGNTANADWKFEESSSDKSGVSLHISQKWNAPKGARVDKQVYLRKGQTAIYEENTVSGLNADMPVGHHPTLDFSGKTARISVSPFSVGYVTPLPFEDPTQKGYCALKAGTSFTSLKKVQTVWGTETDLSVYPARRGFEDLVLMLNDQSQPFAWQAAVVQSEGWAYIGLKDPSVLNASVLWISNGGRHYAPWNGRHTDRIGLEDVTGYFHYGWAESLADNPLKKAGVATTVKFSAKKPTTVRYIKLVAAIPKDFDEVANIARVDEKTIRLTAVSGATADVPLHIDFLQKGPEVFA